MSRSKKYKAISGYKDRIIFKESIITVIDNIVVAFDNSMNEGKPLFGIAWGLSKGLYGANIQLRQERAIEFVEMVRDNPEVFTKEIMGTEEFQDGFVYAFEKYLAQRVTEKRKIIRDIFKGYARGKDKKEFKLERLVSTVEMISLEEVEVLKTFTDGTIRAWHKSQFKDITEKELERQDKNPLNVIQIGEHVLNGMKGMTKFKDEDYTQETLERLLSLGLVITGAQATYGASSSTFKISGFGREFVEYVKNL